MVRQIKICFTEGDTNRILQEIDKQGFKVIDVQGIGNVPHYVIIVDFETQPTKRKEIG